MLLNKDTVLRMQGTAAVLVPYTNAHVERYHTWMQNADLLESTASERLTLEEEFENMSSWRQDPKKLTFIILDESRNADMAGDVNLHILNAETEGFEESCVLAEVEVMVAETASRRKGLATAALRMMMAYTHKHLGITVFIAKVLEGNAPSIQLFQSALRFSQYRHVRAFGEVHLRLWVSDSVKSTLERNWARMEVIPYRDSGYCVAAEQYTSSS